MTWNAASKYRLMLQINNAIVSESTRHGVFSALARELGRIFHFDRFSINLYDPKTNFLSYFAAAKGISPAEISEDERPLAHGAIASAVIRSQQPFVITDLSRHTFWESVRAMRAAGLNATMAFPLIVRQQVLGTLHLSFRKPPDRLEETVEFLKELSSQVAIAVDHMMAHTTLRAINEQLKQQNEFLASQDRYGQGEHELFYESRAMAEVISQAQMVAGSDMAALVTGETGTGKDLIARYIHQLSQRRDALFVKVNCPALSSGLFESELFGHAKGAFTGAQSKRMGRFEMADGGTVFLDEIGELDAGLQAKLLNVLQDRTFERVGESRPLTVDFRLISATNKDLECALRNNTFRWDLFYRLNTVNINLPPLRERLEDIPVLVQRLAAIQAAETHRAVPLFSEASLKAMARYSWPGNVRQLKNLIKQLVIMRSGEKITGVEISAILDQMRDPAQHQTMTLAEMERRHIIRALKQTGGVVGGPLGAADLLGVPRQTLQYRMRKYRIAPRKLAPFD